MGSIEFDFGDGEIHGVMEGNKEIGRLMRDKSRILEKNGEDDDS